MLSNSFLKSRRMLTLLLAFQILFSITYAHTPADTAPSKTQSRTSYNPHDNLAYDQIVARIPLSHAPTGAVVLADLNIALHKAKQQAEFNLCSGQWAPQGTVVYQRGPFVERHSSSANEILSWHYIAFRHPSELACGATSRAAFFLEMSRYLPAWIQIRPAGQRIAFQQGETVMLDPGTVAIK